MFFYSEPDTEQENVPAYVNNANIDTSETQPGEIEITIEGND